MANKYQSIKKVKSKNERKIDIHDRIYKFVIRVINFTKSVPRTPQNFPIVDQLVGQLLPWVRMTRRQMELFLEKILFTITPLSGKRQRKRITGFLLYPIPIQVLL